MKIFLWATFIFHQRLVTDGGIDQLETNEPNSRIRREKKPNLDLLCLFVYGFNNMNSRTSKYLVLFICFLREKNYVLYI